MRYQVLGFVLAGLTMTVLPFAANAGGRSDTKVKASAKGSKIVDNKQTVTITLEVEKDWYIYANPVNYEQFENNRTRVGIKANEKVTAEVKFPAGTLKKGAKYNIYTDKVVIVCEVTRTPGDSSPLQVHVDVNACGLVVEECLPPARIKLTVP
ncbi:MAG: hypothetical protein HY289_10860 [Planctomycetes bacterium]|nr:hypothetical protein [Planctomycetota bacterium]